MFVDLHTSAKLPAETRQNMWLRRLVAGLLSRRTRFHPRPVHVGICTGIVTMGHTWTSNSFPNPSMGDIYWTNWHWGSRFHPDQSIWGLCWENWH